MGTRADYYIGRGTDAEWIGSTAWDGYPEGMPPALLHATTEQTFREQVELLQHRDDFTRPDMGWPWPWATSHLTDYAYAFDPDDEIVWASSFGCAWWPATEPDPDTESDSASTRAPDGVGLFVTFPVNPTDRHTMGKRSGVMVITAAGIADDLP